ncbi:MAG: DUF167 domain-containing protein [Vampirovibrionales bacterium]
MAVLVVKVTPNAKKTELIEIREVVTVKETIAMWYIRLKAPAEDGKANQALCQFLSGYLDVRLEEIHILTGHRSREKRIRLPDTTPLPQTL